MSLDAMPVQQRVAYGKEKEDCIIQCLNERYKKFGYNLVPGTFLEDCKEKTDCWQVAKSGKRYRSAIKVRVSKNDILICFRDPFYGVNHEDTRTGRDVLYEYFQYITLSSDGTIIRVANGKRLHKICKDLWDEFLERVGDVDVAAQKRTPIKIMSSEKYEGGELWLHRDRRGGQPKILGFIPPSLLKKGTEILYHKLEE